VQVDPIKLTLKALGAKRLTLKHDELASSVAFIFNLRRYTKCGFVGACAGDTLKAMKWPTSFKVDADGDIMFLSYIYNWMQGMVGRCRFTISDPELKALLVLAVVPDMNCFQTLLAS
jgi:hypothetical protein